MLAVHRWTPNMSKQVLDYIVSWVQIRGIPFHLLYRDVIFLVARQIGDGDVVDIDYSIEANYQENYACASLNWNVNTPLEFQRTFQFIPGEDTIIRLRYERLKRFCENCRRLTHDTSMCTDYPMVNPGDHSDGSDGDVRDVSGCVNTDQRDAPVREASSSQMVLGDNSTV